MAKPTDNPAWATLDPVDGVSGQPAIIVPSNAKQDSGFLRLERPPRQDLNWFMNLVSLWVDYLELTTDTNIADIAANVVDITKNEDDIITTNGLLSGYIDAFRLIGMPAATVVEITGGRCTDDINGSLFNTDVDANGFINNLYEKDVSASFVAGFGAGGLSSSLVFTNDTNYHCFIIRLADDSIDVGFDTNAEASNLIADHGVTNFRRIFSIRNKLGSLQKMIQYGDYFMYVDTSNQIAIGTIAAGTNLIAFNNDFAPNDISTIFDVSFNCAWSAGTQLASRFALYGDIITSSPPSSSGRFDINLGILDSLDVTAVVTKRILMDGTNNVLTAKTNLATGTAILNIFVECLGYWDTRGRDWNNGLGPTDPRGLFFG